VLIRKDEGILSRLQKLIVDLRTNHNIHMSYTTLAHLVESAFLVLPIVRRTLLV